MLSVKAIIIGTASVATVGGASFLTLRAIQEEEQEEFELSKFENEWKGKSDAERMQLLEKELERLCKNNEDCEDKTKIKKVVEGKPDLKKFFEDKQFNAFQSVASGFSETCKKMVKDMKPKLVGIYCL